MPNMFYLENIDENDFEFDLSQFVYTEPSTNALTLLDRLRIRHDPTMIMLAEEFLRAVTEELNDSDSESESEKSAQTESETTTEAEGEEEINQDSLLIFKLDD